MRQHAHIATSLELGALLDAELVTEVRVLLGHVQGFFALQTLNVGGLGEDVHVELLSC